jgi:hypothetical protein
LHRTRDQYRHVRNDRYTHMKGPARARILLAFMGATTAIMGALYLLFPEPLAAMSGLTIARPAAVAEIRGYYGGLQLGMGTLFFAGLRNQRIAPAALLAAAVLFAGNGLGRALGVVLAGTIDAYNASGILFEFGFSLASLAALRSPGRPHEL